MKRWKEEEKNKKRHGIGVFKTDLKYMLAYILVLFIEYAKYPMNMRIIL